MKATCNVVFHKVLIFEIFQPGGMIIKPDPDAGHDGDETDVATMANVNLENEAKKLQRADIGNEIRNAPGGDEQIYVNKAGKILASNLLPFFVSHISVH